MWGRKAKNVGEAETIMQEETREAASHGCGNRNEQREIRAE